ncbi:tripartite motif-containing protein 15 isoform X1 [Rattus norvegicus]|uniref:tripartite motif-containing protein 15 isoform X1 n=1 Tax=Rattus norvegicus TaxID=10116 RepID=UPI0004E4920A|nr:tripartite motif-containing protein 15 isoform X1 [Rattus norvegicus]|eukprot:XP_008770907.1 PREDICTED: tripartite motif-containing protein 15 isoform X1 [Rattus norvegicus]
MPLTRSLRGPHQVACTVCTRPLQDAVTIACGHAVCLLCLPRAPMGAQLLCPLCQGAEEEKIQTAVTPVSLGPLSETCCEEHGEKIYFFCKTDAELLCVFCREGPAHQAHTVGFLDEAIQPYRDRLRSRLEALRMERDKIEDRKCQEDQKLQEVLMQVESKKQQVEAAFERLKRELVDQRCLLLTRLEELEQQIWKEREEYITTVSQEVDRLGAQVEELEEKCQQPASELLQDARLNQSRYEMKTFVCPEAISSDLIKKIRNLHRKILCLPKMMRTFSGTRAPDPIRCSTFHLSPPFDFKTWFKPPSIVAPACNVGTRETEAGGS